MVLAAMLVHGSSTQMQMGAGIGTRMHRILTRIALIPLVLQTKICFTGPSSYIL